MKNRMEKYLSFLLMLCITLSLTAGVFLPSGGLAGGIPDKDNLQDYINTEQSSGSESQKGTEQESGAETEAEFQVESPEALLKAVWGRYPEKERFAIVGGNPGTYVDGSPASYDMGNAAMVEESFGITPELYPEVKAMASLQQAVNSYVLTIGAYELQEGCDAAAFSEKLYNSLVTKHYIYDKPEKVLVINIAEKYVLGIYGRSYEVDFFKYAFKLSYKEVPVVMTEHTFSK